jgi:uncharacterized protein (TIRG00374 family)
LVSLIGLVIFGVLVVWGGPAAWERVRTSDPVFLALTFIAVGLWIGVGTLRWQTWCNALAGRWVCSTRRYYSIFIAAAAINQLIPPVVGNLGSRPLIYSLVTGERLGQAFIASLLDNVCDLAVFALMAIPAFLGLAGIVSYPVSLLLMGAMVAAGFVVLRLARWRHITMLTVLARFAGRVSRLPRVGPRLARPLQQLRRSTLPTPGATERIYWYSVSLYALSLMRQVTMMEAMRLDMPWLPLILAVPVAHMVLLVSLTPSALGIFELGWTGVLTWAGIAPDASVTFVVGRRLYMTAIIPIWAAIGLLADATPFRTYRRRWAARAQPDELPHSPPTESTPDNPAV